MEQPLLSICIPTFERAPKLARVLEHLEEVRAELARELGSVPEVVVVDNASEDDTPAVLEAARGRLPGLRVLRQRENVGAEANLVAALREARGRYAVYLADDDRLIPGPLAAAVRTLEGEPELVVLQAPWLMWDGAKDEEIRPFYPLERPERFAPGSGLALMDFLLRRGIFPEIAVYRTEVLLKVLHRPRRAHWAHVWLLRMLAHGTVGFDPEPFYRQIMGTPVRGERRQLGVHQTVAALDSHRAGLETGLFEALAQDGSLGMAPELRRVAMDLVQRFLDLRMAVAERFSLGYMLSLIHI